MAFYHEVMLASAECIYLAAKEAMKEGVEKRKGFPPARKGSLDLCRALGVMTVLPWEKHPPALQSGDVRAMDTLKSILWSSTEKTDAMGGVGRTLPFTSITTVRESFS